MAQQQQQITARKQQGKHQIVVPKAEAEVYC